MMKTRLAVAAFALAGAALCAGQARPQGGFKIETGKAFEAAVPKDFYLEGNAIPVEKRNSALATAPSGARMMVGLLDTSGYSSQIQEKYLGMMITEGTVAVCGKSVGVGSYGFGVVRPHSGPGLQGPGAKFKLYNQAGREIAGCEAKWDAKIEHPRPLQVVPGPKGTAQLYLGRDWVELR